MRTLSEIELAKEIGERKEVNLIAFATTPWHALGVNATIHHLKQQNINLCGYIVIMPHQVTGVGLGKENFLIEEFDDIQVVLWGRNNREKENVAEKLWRKTKEVGSELKYYLSYTKFRTDLRTLYWLVPLKPSFQMIPKMASFKSNIWTEIILIDEGLGTYLNSDWIWTKVAFQEGGIVAGIRELFQNMIINRFYMWRLNVRKQVHYHQLFVKENGKFVQNLVAVESFRYVAKKQYGRMKHEQYEKAVIINGDLLSEVGIIKSDADLKVYKEVCNELIEKKIPIILKPHPRFRHLERYNELRCEIDRNQGVALESILAGVKKKPLCIIGVDSTSLVTANILFGVKAIGISDMFLDDNLYKQKRFTNFKRAFSDVVEFPDTVQKLIQQIEEAATEEGNIV